VLVTEVDGRPTPKVIDFGVAKATEQRLTDETFGDTGAIVGTPTYMSPEQADPSSMDIDTRTDVYALGITLYELLAGSTPIDPKQFRRGAVFEMLRMVREVEPPRPSTRLSQAQELPSIAASRNLEPGHLLKWLRGDIDWIVMKALEKDRDRRYETANGFAADIQRFLADEPVVARPPSRGYRLRKFVTRNKGKVVAASLVILALVAGIVGTTVGMVEARKQRDIAEREYRRAREAVDDSFVKVSENRIAIERLGTLLLDETGRLDDAEKAIRRSQSLFVALARSRPGDSEIHSLLAGSYANLADVVERRGDNKAAATLLGQCVEQRGKLLEERPDDLDLLNELAIAEHRYALFAHVLGRDDEARESYRQSVKLYERLVEKQPGAAKSRYELSVTLQNQGRLDFEQGHAETGRIPLERGLAMQEVLVRENPLVGEYRAGLAFAHNTMSDLDRAAGKLKEAGQHAQAARDLLETLVREAPDSLGYRESLAKASNVLGRTALAGGRPDEARQAFARAVELLETLPDPPSWYLYNLACNEALAVPLVKADARQAQVRRAMSALKRAFAAGFKNAAVYRQDSDLDSLRNEPAFQQFLVGLASPE